MLLSRLLLKPVLRAAACCIRSLQCNFRSSAFSYPFWSPLSINTADLHPLFCAPLEISQCKSPQMAIFRSLHVLGFFSLPGGAAARCSAGPAREPPPQPAPRQRGQVVFGKKQMKKQNTNPLLPWKCLDFSSWAEACAGRCLENSDLLGGMDAAR